MKRRTFLRAAAPAILTARMGSAADRPNIVWIFGEDMGPQLGCYGYPLVTTPNLDRLAREGARFDRAFTTAPVCSASRSAFNTGVYQTTTGTHHHRSHRKDGYRLPEGVRLVSERLRDAGYFTANVLEFASGIGGTGKTDFNFTVDKPFDGTHWNQRKAGQPFFAQVNFRAPHKGPAFKEARRQTNLIDPQRVTLPPYFPDHAVVRDEVANYLDAINLLDSQVGVLLDRLERDRVLDNTAIFFMGDNGQCLIRGKQWLYDAGIHVPLLLRWPGVVRAGTVRDEMVLSLDMTATTLAAAGVSLPAAFDGRPLVGAGARQRPYIIAARDRCDMTVDRIRCVRDTRYKYIRNFMPERPYTQHNEYIQREYPTLGVMKELHAAGQLDNTQSLFMAPRKPEVEFYDTAVDPHEVNNLADAPQHRKRVTAMAGLLDDWIHQTGDRGAQPEPEEARRL
ncbi:MAG: sulfatase [Bryobacterales bacterium]|nr:sulfatase [Bryobacterales bacterium]